MNPYLPQTIGVLIAISMITIIVVWRSNNEFREEVRSGVRLVAGVIFAAVLSIFLVLLEKTLSEGVRSLTAVTRNFPLV